jgi:rhomboid protease GluP
MPEHPSTLNFDRAQSPSDPPVMAAPARPQFVPLATYVLIGMNVAVYVLMVVSGVSATDPSADAALRWGADYGPYTLHGQPWRLFTSMFVHFGIVHIGFNMYVLYQVGRLTEQLFGRVKYVFLYLATGLVGGLASLLVHPDVVGAGASGAIFGVYGAFLGLLFVRRHVIPKPAMKAMVQSATMFLGINLVYGLSSGRIDMSAHIGGLLSGIVLGWCLTARPQSLA